MIWTYLLWSALLITTGAFGWNLFQYWRKRRMALLLFAGLNLLGAGLNGWQLYELTHPVLFVRVGFVI